MSDNGDKDGDEGEIPMDALRKEGDGGDGDGDGGDDDVPVGVPLDADKVEEHDQDERPAPADGEEPAGFAAGGAEPGGRQRVPRFDIVDDRERILNEDSMKEKWNVYAPRWLSLTMAVVGVIHILYALALALYVYYGDHTEQVILIDPTLPYTEGSTIEATQSSPVGNADYAFGRETIALRPCFYTPWTQPSPIANATFPCANGIPGHCATGYLCQAQPNQFERRWTHEAFCVLNATTTACRREASYSWGEDIKQCLSVMDDQNVFQRTNGWADTNGQARMASLGWDEVIDDEVGMIVVLGMLCLSVFYHFRLEVQIRHIIRENLARLRRDQEVSVTVQGRLSDVRRQLMPDRRGGEGEGGGGDDNDGAEEDPAAAAAQLVEQINVSNDLMRQDLLMANDGCGICFYRCCKRPRLYGAIQDMNMDEVNQGLWEADAGCCRRGSHRAFQEKSSNMARYVRKVDPVAWCIGVCCGVFWLFVLFLALFSSHDAVEVVAWTTPYCFAESGQNADMADRLYFIRWRDAMEVSVALNLCVSLVSFVIWFYLRLAMMTSEFASTQSVVRFQNQQVRVYSTHNVWKGNHWAWTLSLTAVFYLIYIRSADFWAFLPQFDGEVKISDYSDN